LGSNESQDQDRHGYETKEEKDNEKTDITNGEMRQRVSFSVNIVRARVFDWRSRQRHESDKR